MIKLMILLMLNIIPLSINLENINVSTFEESFINQVDNDYEYYEQFDEYSNSEYSLIVFKGIFNNKPSYAVKLSMDNPKAYYVLLEANDASYKVPFDDYGNSTAIAIESVYNIHLSIYNKDDKKEDYNVNLGRFVKDQFDLTNASTGKGEGKEFTSLTAYIPKVSFFDTFIIVLSSVIVISLVLLLFLFIKKKGMFNKEKRTEGIVSIKEILRKETNDIVDTDYLKDYNPNTTIYENAVFDETVDNKVEVDSRIITIEDQIKDIKAYLQDLGYVTEYSALSEDEKNNIMIELMKLKEQGKISLDDYYEESAELWKK